MESRALTVRETVDARKLKYGEDDLDEVFKGAKEIVVAKGKRSLSFRPGDPALADEALGRSGTLRAPTVRVGARFLVGYSDAAWDEFFA